MSDSATTALDLELELICRRVRPVRALDADLEANAIGVDRAVYEREHAGHAFH
jgi:hypothetical protein